MSGTPRLYPGIGPDERTSFQPYSAFDVPEDLRELHGRYDVEATARRVRNFRYTHEWIAMILGGWIATIPELPVKTGLGKIVWESAQAADALGKRLPELRAGRNAATASQPPNQGYADLIQEVARPESPTDTIEKIAGMFDVLMPHLVEVYEETIRATDAICDAPTIELLDGAVRHLRRHVAWGGDVLARLCDVGGDAARERRRARAAEVRARLEACGGVTGTLPGRDA
ncbi:MAG TPA: hypothetical protein VFD92_14535 [Candidatus Binatia bacterium]|nr:hypothetical protein [Candidatus Binatia bacterium]